MADINIERRPPSVWPWIIGLMVLALLIWGLVEMFGNGGEPVVTDTATDTVRIDTGVSESPALPPPAPPGAMPADTGAADSLGARLDTAAAGAAP